MKREEIFNLAIKTYGKLHQISKASEECSELSADIQKLLQLFLIPGSKNEIEESKIRTKIEEEIADVEITIEQLKIILEAKKAVERFHKVKLARLKEDLNKITILNKSHLMNTPLDAPPDISSDAIIDQDAGTPSKLLS